jgi:2-C-methyl-D-erythritol 4-phosphate cytidylyltransferase
MVGWSLRTFAAIDEIAEIAIVTEPMWLERMDELASPLLRGRTYRIVEGGATRQASAYNGLRALSATCDAVLVHDGARPLVQAIDVRAGMREVRAGRAAVLASPVVDTIKVVEPQTNRVRATLDRAELWGAQTPQFAMRAELERAHARAKADGIDVTDDVALLEAMGIEVVVVPASAENFKVTHPSDIARAEALLGVRV